MKNRLFFILLVSSINLFAQFKYQGLVKDSKTGQAIPFCAVAFKGSSSGCISNEEGVFQIFSEKNLDTLLFNCIGYKDKRVAIGTFLKDQIILLEVSEFKLDEVVIFDKDDFLYKILAKCRNKMMASGQYSSKTYFVLESTIDKQAVELLECYYNSRFTISSLQSLEFKNGRVGLAPYQNRFFVNANISKAFMQINLIGGNTNLPDNPFEFNERKLRKTYRLKLISVSQGENELYHIECTPVKNSENYFAAEVWIDKKSGTLNKISLQVSHTRNHPFLPLFKGEGSIKDVSMQINKTFIKKGEDMVLDHIDFSYQLNYHHRQNLTLLQTNNDTSYTVSTKGLMYFYDLEKPFVLPFFKYDEEFSDYNKIAALSYNENFWSNNTSVEYSQTKKKGIQYFKKNGILLNFKNGLSTTNTLLKNGKFFENNYVMWSAEKRISFKQNKLKHDSTLANSGSAQSIQTNLYQLKAQIFLDLNPTADSVQHYSASIFDVYETYYHLTEEPYTNCFINIYFDLYEIERRKMEAVFAKNKLTLGEMEQMYQSGIKAVENISNQYLAEVERGKKTKSLEKWNLYIKENLGIDNMAIFQLGGQ